MSQPIPHRPTGSESLVASTSTGQPSRLLGVARKVPEVTLYFWVIKLLTTAMGESISDYLVHRFDPYIAVAMGAITFGITIVLQFAVRRYVPWIYWLTVAMVAVFGTMCADVLHVGLGIPYAVSTAFFAISLVIVFLVWYGSEKTLSIHTIVAGRREVFYWATVVMTFALGTATGDLTAYTFDLGFLVSALLFLAIFAIPALGYRFLGWNEIAAFWFAYVVTRPIGASFADWFGKAKTEGGLGIGNGLVSLILAVLIAALVAYLTVSHRDEQGHGVTRLN